MRSVFKLFLVFSFFSTSFAQTVPFKGEISDQISDKKTVFVLGSGPAGLIAAKVLLDQGLHDQIVIVEKRDEFSRFQKVNFFPESWPMIRSLGLEAEFVASSKEAPCFNLYPYINGTEASSIIDCKTPAPSQYDYSGKLGKEVFDLPGFGRHFIRIFELQTNLAQSLIQNSRISLVHGEAEILPVSGQEKKHSLKFYPHNKQGKTQIYQPDLIVVAEGANSANRERLGIKFEQKTPTEYWCIGILELNQSWEKVETGHVSLFFDKKDGKESVVKGFGIFDSKNKEVFFNSRWSEAPKKDVGLDPLHDSSLLSCLQQNVYELMKHDSRHLPIVLPNRASELPVKQASWITIAPSKASHFTSGSNVILLGDAAGNATPKAGVGLSLVTSVYPQAFKDLLSKWTQADRDQVLKTYSDRISEVVDYWHFRIMDQDLR